VVRALGAAAGRTPCHLVGGVVRDRLTDAPNQDFDVTVPRGAQAIAERLADALPARLVRLGGDRFAAIRLVGDGFQVDLWDRRGNSLEADLYRRDFTINSIAVALTGEVIDPLGGRDDLRDGLLRANRESSFEEDPLRVLRLVRFAARGYRVEAKTARSARRAAPAIARVAAERVREELRLTLTARDGESALRWLAELGLYPALWVGGVPAESRPTGLARAAHKLERRLAKSSVTPSEAALARHALLVSALSDESAATEATLRRLARRGLLSRHERRQIEPLVGHTPPPRSEPARRRFLHAAGPGWRLAVAVRSALADPTERRRWDRLAGSLEHLAATSPDLFDPAPLLDGDEIRALAGLEPGPELGRRVAALRAAQVEGKVRTRTEAVEWARQGARRRSALGRARRSSAAD
jgi:tRNA nucleotidyltransferase (CCA-adding enzyme)